MHEERFEPTHGPLRRAAREAVGRFLDCGLLEHGFARVRCGTCRAEFLVAFRCMGRHFCPSCHARRLAEWGLWLDERLLAPVAHRQVTDGGFRRDGTFVPLPAGTFASPTTFSATRVPPENLGVTGGQYSAWCWRRRARMPQAA